MVSLVGRLAPVVHGKAAGRADHRLVGFMWILPVADSVCMGVQMYPKIFVKNLSMYIYKTLYF
jgi:hypothetical protein